MRSLLMLLLITLAAPALADPYYQSGSGFCGSRGQPALHRIELTGGSAATTIYVDDENYALGNGIWMYAETNELWVDKGPGIYFEGLSNANLQRGGSTPLVPGDNDICMDAPGFPPDTFLL